MIHILELLDLGIEITIINVLQMKNLTRELASMKKKKNTVVEASI